MVWKMLKWSSVTMGVFRADEESAEDKPEESEAEEPDVYFLADPSEEESDERQQLGEQAQRFGSNGLTKADAPYGQKERGALNRLDQEGGQPSGQPVSTLKRPGVSGGSQAAGGRKGFSGGFGNKQKMAAGLAAFFVPMLVGILLLLFALQAGLALEHIRRVSTGLRFGPMHLQLSRRFNHLRREYVRLADYSQSQRSSLAPYAETTLTSRLLGVDPDRIYRSLDGKGYTMKYTTLRGGALITKGRRTLTAITGPDGVERQIRTHEDALENLRQIRADFDDNELGRFRAMRSAFLTAKQINLPFLRFRLIIDGIRDGSLRNSIRGSPGQFFQQRLSEDLLEGKKRLLNRLPRIPQVLERFGAGDLVEEARKDLADSSLSAEGRLGKLRGFFDSRQAALAISSGVSIALAVVTLACVVRELGVMIRDAFKMKVRGMQDSAAALLTTTSQIKAGDMEGEVVSDMTRRFEGFAVSANYQVGLEPQSAGPFVGRTGSDFSAELAPGSVFDGWAVEPILATSSSLSPANFLETAIDFFKANAGFLADAIDLIPESVRALASTPARAAAALASKTFEEVCERALDFKWQVATVIVEIVATIAAIVVTGGAAGAARLSAGQTAKEVGRVLLRGAVAGYLAGVALDVLLFDYLLPGVVRDAAGGDTLITAPEDYPGSAGETASLIGGGLLPSLNTADTLNGASNNQRAANGARNYALVDYGMHYLSSSEALASGGSRLSAEEAVAQTQQYLAFQREQHADEGWWNNLVSLENPYSLASSWVVAASTAGSWQQKGQTYFAQLLDGLSIFQKAHAQAVANERIQEVLYPGQEWVISFDPGEVSGENALFGHESNTAYVEGNLEDLRQRYGACIGLDASDFLLAQFGTGRDEYGREYYPGECDEQEARRYKSYYQDCVLIENLRLWGSDHSSMFSSRCDHLLSPENQEYLKITSLEQPGAAGLLAELRPVWLAATEEAIIPPAGLSAAGCDPETDPPNKYFVRGRELLFT